VQRKFLNARSPLRLLERGLHGGLGAGNLGVVLAGPGVGKTSFLVCVALDELLRGGHVLHVSQGQSLAHVRAYYDTLFDELAATTQLEDGATVHTEVDRRRSIRVYPPGGLSASKLRDAVKLEAEAGAAPTLVVLEGLDLANLPREEVADLKALARELGAEVWLEAHTREEGPAAVPPAVARFGDLVSVVLALEPGDRTVALRALKDHDNPSLEALHVALDPRTLLLVRS
jgi:predicted ATP-dependent serine protease